MISNLMGQRWLGIALLVFAGVYAAFVYDAQRLPPAARRLRAADIPISVEELEEKYTPEPVEDNGAFLYIEAMAKLIQPDEQMLEHLPYVGDLEFRYGHEFTPQQRDALHTYVAMNAEPIALIQEAQKKPFVRLPVDRFNFTEGNPYLTPARTLARLVSCATLNAALAGDIDMMMQMGITGLRLHELVSEGALIIDELVAKAISTTAMKNLEHGLYYLRPQETYPWLEILHSERYTDLRIYQEMFKNEMTYMFVSSRLYFEGSESAQTALFFEWTQDKYFPQNWLMYSISTIIASLSKDSYEVTTLSETDLLGSMYNPFHMPDDTTWNGRNTHAAILAPAFIRTFSVFAPLIAEAASAQAALASLLYQNDHGRLPDTLEDLAPHYLDAVPRDPYTPDGTIRYRIRENHAVFYSVGPNEQDDGGTEPERHLEKGGDIIFRLPLAERDMINRKRQQDEGLAWLGVPSSACGPYQNRERTPRS